MKKPLLKKLNWLIIAQISLVLIALVLMIFNVMHYEHDEASFGISGFNLLLGKQLGDEPEYLLKFNVWLVLFAALIVCVNCLNLFNLGKLNKYLNVGKTFVNGAAFVASYGMISTYCVARTLHSDMVITLTLIGKIFILVLLALFLLSIYDLAINLKLDDFKSKGAKLVKAVLALVMLCGLFAPLFKISNASNVICLNGIGLMFGKEYEEPILSFTKIPGNLVTIFAFASVLIILAINVVSCFIELDVLKKFGLVLTIFAFYYFVNLEAANKMGIVSTLNRGVTTFESIIALAGVGLFIASLVEFIKPNDLNSNLKLVAFVCVIFAATAIYLPSYHLYTNYGTETNYNNAYTSISSVLLGEKAADYKVHPLMVYLSYGSIVAAAILSAVEIKLEKLKYFICFMLTLVGILFFVLFIKNVFPGWLAHSTYNKVDLYQNGIVYIIFLTIPTLIYLYISSTQPSALVDDSEYKVQPTSKKHK